MKSKIFLFFGASLIPLLLSACSPVVRIEAPDKPIEINMNVSIKHEIMIKVEKDVQKMFESEKDLF